MTGARERRRQHDTTDRHELVTSLLTRTTGTTGTGLTVHGESSVGIGGNGNTGGHPGAVQEADPQPRVRAVESE